MLDGGVLGQVFLKSLPEILDENVLAYSEQESKISCMICSNET